MLKSVSMLIVDHTKKLPCYFRSQAEVTDHQLLIRIRKLQPSETVAKDCRIGMLPRVPPELCVRVAALPALAVMQPT